MKRSSYLLLGLTAAWLSQTSASAQPANPYLQYARNQMTLANMYGQQQAFNQTLLTTYRATVATSPYSAFDYYPSYYAPYVPPVAPVNPYVPGGGYGYGGSYGANPYVPVDPGYGGGGNPYNPYNPYSPYGYGYGGGVGSALMGQADIIRASGKIANDWEDARLKRELALQAQLDTKKKKFELQMYIKANTPTYTQEQEAAARMTLRRIQTNSLPAEVSAGKSLNLLLRDLEKFPGKKISIDPMPLSDNTLNHLNVTKSTYGMGLLRDGGKIDRWPTAVLERMTGKERDDLQKLLQNLVKEANNGRVDANPLKDAQHEIDRIRKELVSKVNEVPGRQYLDGKRFLQELDEALRAIEDREAVNNVKFQRFIEEGKGNLTVQDLVDHMQKNGLHFGPATAADEAAYRTVHAAIATYDIAMNSQLGIDKE